MRSLVRRLGKRRALGLLLGVSVVAGVVAVLLGVDVVVVVAVLGFTATGTGLLGLWSRTGWLWRRLRRVDARVASLQGLLQRGPAPAVAADATGGTVAEVAALRDDVAHIKESLWTLVPDLRTELHLYSADVKEDVEALRRSLEEGSARRSELVAEAVAPHVARWVEPVLVARAFEVLCRRDRRVVLVLEDTAALLRLTELSAAVRREDRFLFVSQHEDRVARVEATARRYGHDHVVATRATLVGVDVPEGKAFGYALDAVPTMGEVSMVVASVDPAQAADPQALLSSLTPQVQPDTLVVVDGADDPAARRLLIRWQETLDLHLEMLDPRESGVAVVATP